VAGVQQQAAGDTTDVAGASGDEQFHDMGLSIGSNKPTAMFPP
jgi:hypothetical protein